MMFEPRDDPRPASRQLTEFSPGSQSVDMKLASQYDAFLFIRRHYYMHGANSDIEANRLAVMPPRCWIYSTCNSEIE
jgi:hypothetical protein